MAVTIRSKTLPLPILQGGMGVGVSLDRLAGAVAACGGMGTISTAACGFQEPNFDRNPRGANLRALARQVRRAREMAKGAGLVAVKAMVATTQYADSIRTALRLASNSTGRVISAKMTDRLNSAMPTYTNGCQEKISPSTNSGVAADEPKLTMGTAAVRSFRGA